MICSVMLSACLISLDGSMGGLVSRRSTVAKEHPTFILNEYPPLCELNYSDYEGHILAATGQQLAKCIDASPAALLYLWQPNCKAEACVSLSVAQDFADAHNLDLFVVAEYYDYERTVLAHQVNRPIIGINTQQYKSNKTKKYLKRFYADLGIKQEEMNRFVVFVYGEASHFASSLDMLSLSSNKI